MSVRYSFILPAYKTQYLNQALQSLQQLAYSDFEVLISDDCSPENVYEICKPYLEDARFFYSRNESNIGAARLSEHWNKLIERAQGCYIIIASDDDLYHPEFLSVADSLVAEYPDVNLLRLRACRIDESNGVIEEDPLAKPFVPAEEYLFNATNTNLIHCIGNYIFKADYLKSMGGFVRFPLAWFSDDATVAQCALKGVAQSHQILFDFRSSSQNLSNENAMNATLCESKVMATCQFYEWFCTYISQLTPAPSALAQHQYQALQQGYKNRCQLHLQIYYRYVGFKCAKQLYRWMQHEGFLFGAIARFTYWAKWLSCKCK